MSSPLSVITPLGARALHVTGLLRAVRGVGLRLTVFQWQRTQELRSGKVTLWDHQFELPHRHLEGDGVIQPSAQMGTETHRLHLAGNG